MHLPSASICFLEAGQNKMNCEQTYMQGGLFVLRTHPISCLLKYFTNLAQLT